MESPDIAYRTISTRSVTGIIVAFQKLNAKPFANADGSNTGKIHTYSSLSLKKEDESVEELRFVRVFENDADGADTAYASFIKQAKAKEPITITVKEQERIETSEDGSRRVSSANPDLSYTLPASTNVDEIS